jgi:hypothetical protein
METINKIEDISLKQIKKIFPNKNNVKFEKLQITTEGIYSVSGYHAAEHLVYLIKKYFKKNDINITDGTGNCGSDTIIFSFYFKNVNSIELDNTNYKVLENNIKQYNLKNIHAYNGSSLDIIKTLKNQDCVFIDAPWTGRDYKKNISMKLFMDNKELSEIYNMLKKYTDLFIFKVPINYDFTFFIQNTKLQKYYIHSYIDNNKVIKYYYIFAPSI